MGTLLGVSTCQRWQIFSAAAVHYPGDFDVQWHVYVGAKHDGLYKGNEPEHINVQGSLPTF